MSSSEKLRRRLKLLLRSRSRRRSGKPDEPQPKRAVLSNLQDPRNLPRFPINTWEKSLGTEQPECPKPSRQCQWLRDKKKHYGLLQKTVPENNRKTQCRCVCHVSLYLAWVHTGNTFQSLILGQYRCSSSPCRYRGAGWIPRYCPRTRAGTCTSRSYHVYAPMNVFILGRSPMCDLFYFIYFCTSWHVKTANWIEERVRPTTEEEKKENEEHVHKDVCGKAFTQLSSLIWHERVRRREVPYRFALRSLREYVWEYQSMCAGGSLRFRSRLAGRLLWGVDRLCKALEKVSEGNLEICITLKNGRNITLFMGLETSHATAYTNKLWTKLHQASIASP